LLDKNDYGRASKSANTPAPAGHEDSHEVEGTKRHSYYRPLIKEKRASN